MGVLDFVHNHPDFMISFTCSILKKHYITVQNKIRKKNNMLTQEYIEAQTIMNQAQKDLETIFDQVKPQTPEDQEAHNSLLKLIDQLKSMDAFYNHLKTAKIEALSPNEKLFVNLIKKNKENLK